jgi:hypothetical protein
MKKRINDYISKYLHKHIGHEGKYESFAMFIEDFFQNMEEEYDDVREAFYDELENFTEEVDEEMAHAIVDNLKRKDNTHSGAKWSMEEVETVCKQYDVKNKIESVGKHYDMLRFWISMNYVYAVHYNINRNLSGYVDLAIDEMTNKNMCFDDLVKHVFRKM